MIMYKTPILESVLFWHCNPFNDGVAYNECTFVVFQAYAGYKLIAVLDNRIGWQWDFMNI